ncbi:hypothetical protein DB35_26080 [Streptomyces abyssalis]|uniref:Uncharacterized protein n=1 Tax=Streptomyces abyssalis TaxID=933944 RepID=A0A1E7JMU5_9ACTN|nr:hypothetical protein [Streptomyces abyssalis]OEU87029.1 hypothetical protein DB35_26080 [Streptomyces abyssalis]OEU89586.1 hypothetical protein AN215_07485 [Streptomyces abyssalis]OEV31941.1 hypothetical protein AN219_01975 [Streptomyces nanshensis]
MSAPLRNENSGQGGSGAAPRPTEHQMRMARIRAAATGESLSQVLSVFMGAGRHGEEAGAPPTGPEAPLAADPSDPSDPAATDAEAPEQLAPVIPLTREARGDAAAEPHQDDT